MIAVLQLYLDLISQQNVPYNINHIEYVCNCWEI